MKVLVTGAAGMLGGAVVRHAARLHNVVNVDLADADLTDPAAVEFFQALHYLYQ